MSRLDESQFLNLTVSGHDTAVVDPDSNTHMEHAIVQHHHIIKHGQQQQQQKAANIMVSTARFSASPRESNVLLACVNVQMSERTSICLRISAVLAHRFANNNKTNSSQTSTHHMRMNTVAPTIQQQITIKKRYTYTAVCYVAVAAVWPRSSA